MLVCYCNNFVPVRQGENNHMNAERIQRQERQAHYYNRTAKDLHPLQEGDVVRLRPFNQAKKRVVWDKGDLP